MKVKVGIGSSGAGQNAQETLDIHCGSGQQILRWLACAACAQLAYKRGEVVGRYVPQAVIKDGNVLDVDMVLCEVANDNDALQVEYSSGPVAFTTRWERRPKTPPLTWDGADDRDAEDVSPSAWLDEWDLAAEGLAGLASTQDASQHQPQQLTQKPRETDQQQGKEQQQQQPPAGQPAQQQQHAQLDAAAQADLERVRGVLQAHAGALQMLFLLFTSEASTPIDTVHRMSLPQFKLVLQAAKVTSNSLPPEKMDDLYMMVQSAPGTLARKGQTQVSTNGLDFADFLVALIHVSHYKFVTESFITGASSTPLSTKLLSLLQDCICTHLYPEVQRRLDKLRGAATAQAQMLLQKGRRLTEQVLERCQIRRVRTKGQLCVPSAYILKHLERWGLLGREFTLQELAPVIIFAKQASSDPYRFVLHAQPLALNYDEFEKLLLGIAMLQARVRKRVDAVDEVLGELLDTVYKKSGVLLLPLQPE